MIGGGRAAAARARAGRCTGDGQRARPVAPCALPLVRDPRTPGRLRERRRGGGGGGLLVVATPTGSSSSERAPALARLLAPARASAAPADASAPPPAPAPEDENNNNNLVINADAIPPTAALRVRGVLSPTHPHPGPWAPPLLSERDHAPDEFLPVTSLRPGPVWYPAWMRYRRRDGNDLFWSDKLSRNTMDVPMFEKRWTMFSTVYYLFSYWRFRGFPPTFRYLIASAYRNVMQRLYEGHKRLVLWQCKLEAALATRAVERRRAEEAAAVAAGEASSSSSSSASPYGPRPGASFSRLMAMRRLHWQNSPVAELLYLQNVALTGRVHQLPPRVLRRSPPTLFWLF